MQAHITIYKMVHLSLVTFTCVTIVIAWFLYRKNTKWLDLKAKLVPLRVFTTCDTTSFVEAHKRKRGRPSLESTLTPVLTKLVKGQSTPTDDVRKDAIDHIPDWKEQ